MIAYIFTEPELKFLCGALNVRGLAKHQFAESPLTDAECEQAIGTLSEKDFISVQSGGITVNSGIALLIGALGKAKRLLIGDGEKIFTAYIANELYISLIHIKCISVSVLLQRLDLYYVLAALKMRWNCD